MTIKYERPLGGFEIFCWYVVLVPIATFILANIIALIFLIIFHLTGENLTNYHYWGSFGLPTTEYDIHGKLIENCKGTLGLWAVLMFAGYLPIIIPFVLVMLIGASISNHHR